MKRILNEGSPVLQRDISLKAKPFLQKYGIKYDLSNYQNDGYLRAGGYKFWFDGESFKTNAPNYSNKSFADITELLTYALNIKEAEGKFKDSFGSAYNARKGVVKESYRGKYSPATNYKHVQNLIIKARRAVKEGNYDLARDLIFDANETIHEDEMTNSVNGKNVYNIMKKQLSNLSKIV